MKKETLGGCLSSIPLAAAQIQIRTQSSQLAHTPLWLYDFYILVKWMYWSKYQPKLLHKNGKCIYRVNKLHSCQNKSVSDVQQIYMHTFNTGQQLNVRKRTYSYDIYTLQIK